MLRFILCCFEFCFRNGWRAVAPGNWHARFSRKGSRNLPIGKAPDSLFYTACSCSERGIWKRIRKSTSLGVYSTNQTTTIDPKEQCENNLPTQRTPCKRCVAIVATARECGGVITSIDDCLKQKDLSENIGCCVLWNK